MKKNDLKLAAVAVIAVVTIASQIGDNLELCDSGKDKCELLTTQEYTALKLDLAGKLDRNDALGWNEYQTLIAVMDREAKAKSGWTFSNISSNDELRKQLAKKLYE